MKHLYQRPTIEVCPLFHIGCLLSGSYGPQPHSDDSNEDIDDLIFGKDEITNPGSVL